MKHALRVVVRTGTEPGPVLIDFRGCLTEASRPNLIRVVVQAALLEGCSQILVDLDGLAHMEPAGLEEFQRRIGEKTHPRDQGPGIAVKAPSLFRHCSRPSSLTPYFLGPVVTDPPETTHIRCLDARPKVRGSPQVV